MMQFHIRIALQDPLGAVYINVRFFLTLPYSPYTFNPYIILACRFFYMLSGITC